MKARGEAFYAGNTYLLSGVLFERTDLPSRRAAAAAADANANGSNGHNGNGHTNGNGNGSVSDKNLNVYHRVEIDGAAAGGGEAVEADLSPQLLRLLTAL